MKSRLLVPLLFVVLLAGCGGSSVAKLAAGDVAVVGSQHVTLAQFTQLVDQAKSSYAQQKKPFPKVGTSAYETLKSQAVTLLVQQAEREDKATGLGVKVTDADVQTRLTQIKKQYFSGSEAKYQAQLTKQHLTDTQVRTDIRSQLISEKLFAAVTKKVKVSDADIHEYYSAHLSTYTTPSTRAMRHILVKQKSLADSLYKQLKAGADFCKLAKAYSTDTSSGKQCGKLTDTQGTFVKSFEAVAFTTKTNVVNAPVKSQFGWHIIEALGPVKPSKATPEKQVASTISQTLLQDKKNAAMTDWVNSLQKGFCSGSKLKYQVGYTPSPDPCAVTTPVTTSPATTTP